MYRIAVCEDDPRAAEQNCAMTCRILDGRGWVRGRDYDVEVFSASAPLVRQLTEDARAFQLLLLDIRDYPGFALDSFPTYPLEYLLKPVDEKRLAAALEWDWRQRHIQPERPLLRLGGWALPLDDIVYLETAGRKTALHTREERIEHPVPLSRLKDELGEKGFCPSHFSYLVNLSHVKRVERDRVLLDTGETVPVSRRYYRDFLARHVGSLK